MFSVGSGFLLLSLGVYFFFQAEDGIRDGHVTGVQTCALPIFFRTAGVAQRILAAALNTPVGIATSASEGGPWGMALLALFSNAEEEKLEDFLDGRIFNRAAVELKAPETRDVAGFNSYLERFRHGLPLEDAAVATMPIEN